MAGAAPAAHAHGTLLALVLVVAALWAEKQVPPRAALAGLRLGAAVMPLGFALAVLAFRGRPGPLIWAAPPAALLVIFGVFAIALSHFRKLPAKGRGRVRPCLGGSWSDRSDTLTGARRGAQSAVDEGLTAPHRERAPLAVVEPGSPTVERPQRGRLP
jgi:hypothetical protein